MDNNNISDDIIRVFRLVQYVGPRSKVEQAIKGTIHGTRIFGIHQGIGGSTGLVSITATTLAEFPDTLVPMPCQNCGEFKQAEVKPVTR